jgi:hypothetical protein
MDNPYSWLTSGALYRSRSLFFFLAYVALVGIYWSVRYAGSAAEVDTMRMTMAAEGTLVNRTLIPPRFYHAGYGFPVQLAFASATSSLPVQTVQLASGLWLPVLGLAAFVAYREMLGKPGLAVLAAFLLFLQPDFLFYVLRASHEKATWLYALLLLFLVVRSYRHARQPRQMLVYILLFYLVFYGLAASNALFACSFITALGISFGGEWLLSRFRSQNASGGADPALPRLLITSIACLLIVFVFTGYIYPPASSLYMTLASLVDRLSSLFLGAQPADPYRYVQSAWLSPQVYLALTLPQWLINLLSLVVWALGARHLDASDRGRWLLWLMYTGFGVQLALSILADISGFLSINLQVRQFTPFTLLSSPMAALLLGKGIERVRARQTPIFRAAIAALVVVSGAAALLKVTNDPLVGNQWMFYTPGELEAGRWADGNIRSQAVWLDTSSHLLDVLKFQQGYDWVAANDYQYGYPKTPPPYVLISHLTRLRANRSGLALPSTVGYLQVYDNGDAQLYHRRPQTPYQR